MKEDLLYKKHNYLNKDMKYIIGLPIRVYDMNSGGYTVLKKANVFSKKEIEYLDSLPKFERNVYIGNKIREDNLSEILMEGFVKARKLFMYYNDIIDEDILSIKKDALFLINRPAKNLNFSGYSFKVEDTFSSYYYINEKEIYFSNKDFRIELKGINDIILEKHREFFLDDLCNIFRLNEGKDFSYRNRFIQEYRRLYLTRQLDVGCYRELNENSCFLYKKPIGQQKFLIEDIDDVNAIDIRYNYINYLLELFRMIL